MVLFYSNDIILLYVVQTTNTGIVTLIAQLFEFIERF